ncbi:MAG: XRE family transcriptional regulator [Actinobacteria bacterium]|nr:XRE family transcriptional regulator [Actinomycetota bacterium]
MSATPGQLIRDARRTARLSQTDLARRAGVAQSVISAYESDHREPGMAMLSKLIEATGHQLTLNVQPLPGRRLGLPDTPLGRRLRQHRRAVIDLAEGRGLRNVRVFGSVARAEDREGSDIDLLVDVDDGVGLVAIAGLARQLTDLLGVPVDIIPAGSLKRTLQAEALAEAVPL